VLLLQKLLLLQPVCRRHGGVLVVPTLCAFSQSVLLAVSILTLLQAAGSRVQLGGWRCSL
jgi:hypothetical protein